MLTDLEMQYCINQIRKTVGRVRGLNLQGGCIMSTDDLTHLNLEKDYEKLQPDIFYPRGRNHKIQHIS